MIFLEIVGVVVLLVIFGIGAWHVSKYISNREQK